MFTLTCMASELARAVSLATQVSGGAKQLDILKSCMIAVSDGFAVIAATNLDHSIRVKFPADGDGEVFVDTAALAQKSAALRSNQPVTITSGDKFITVVQGKTRWKLPTIADPSGFPMEITQPLAGDAIRYPAGEFLGAVNAARSIVNDGAASVINMGVFLDMSDGFRAVGADGTGLAVIAPAIPALPVSVVFPNAAVAAVNAVFKGTEYIDVTASEDAVSVSTDDTTYRTKLVGIAFSDWLRAYNYQTKPINGSVVIDAADLVQTVKRATAIMEDRSGNGMSTAVRLTFEDGECTALAKNRNGEEGSDACMSDGDAGSVLLSAGVLLTAIGSFQTERIKIGISTEPDSFCAITVEEYPASEAQNVRVIMPRRL